jgi:DNA-binding XRE family transcriptional regulator
MDMQVDAQLIRNERLKRAWSQEHLAQVSGLGLRTIQRIENGEKASLETVKALAAVLELRVEGVLVDMPPPPVAITPPIPSHFRLFKPWSTFVAGCAFTLATLGGVFMMQGASAEQIDLDFAMTLNGEAVSVSELTSEDGSPAVIEVKELVKVDLVPTVRDDGFVLVEAKIYTHEDGEFKLVSEPAMLTKNGTPVLIRVGNEESFDGSKAMMLELKVTPTIE